MSPKIIQNEAEYQAALARIEVLMDAVLDLEGERGFDVLVDLVVKYEEVQFPI